MRELSAVQGVAAPPDGFDAVVVRNSGSGLGHKESYDVFRERALRDGTRPVDTATTTSLRSVLARGPSSPPRQN
ncbi:hypothetical protein ACI2L1_17905 [Streptomyces sp. NPDC019531]|uniref:hypothetical protein n=1 Tax=Streptomyces sp. NPDC019531 TaxID=3365062 RepID=UPI0038505549